MKELLLQAIKFFGISGLGWILDFVVYIALCLIIPEKFINNCISSWLAVTFVFLFSTRAVFESKSKIPLTIKYIIFILYQIALVCFISRILVYIDGVITQNITFLYINNYAFIIAKIVVTPISMILNFLVMKFLIEKV